MAVPASVGPTPLRILLALHQFPPVGAGGTEQLVRWTALGLQQNGHAASIVSAVPRRRGTATEVPVDHHDADGLEVHFLTPTPGIGDTSRRITREFDDSDAGAAFGHAIDAARPDVIHFFHLAGLTAAAMRQATTRRIPFILTITDFWFECPTVQLLLDDESLCDGPRGDRMNCARHLAMIRWPAMRPLGLAALADRPAAAAIKAMSGMPGVANAARALRALQSRSDVLRDAMSCAAAVVVPNEFMRARLLAFGVPDRKLHMVPYGVPATAPVQASRERNARRPRVIFIGTLAVSKGAHLLLEALRIAGDLDVDVDIYGGLQADDYAAKLQQLAGADPRVQFRGTFDNRQFADVLDAADLLVIPSLWNENSPLVLLQALAQRCPVLVADVPGLAAHMRPALDGWTFVRGNADDLARQLRRICRDGAARAAVRATPYVARTLAPYLTDLMQLYGNAVAAHGGKA